MDFTLHYSNFAEDPKSGLLKWLAYRQSEDYKDALGTVSYKSYRLDIVTANRQKQLCLSVTGSWIFIDIQNRGISIIAYLHQ